MTLFDDSTSKRANKEHQLDIDFTRAMYKAFKEELKGFLLRKSRRLLPFDQIKDKLEISFTRNLGVQEIAIDNIVGSEGRYRSFTRQFLPIQEDLRDRWKKVSQARDSKKDLPPVELYKVCNAYFVKDGHHRVSVARTKGNKYIEAQVYEYECDVPLEKDTDFDIKESPLASFIVKFIGFKEIEQQYGLYDHYQPEQMWVVPPGTDLERFYPPRGDERDSPVGRDLRRFLREPDKPVIHKTAAL